MDLWWEEGWWWTATFPELKIRSFAFHEQMPLLCITAKQESIRRSQKSAVSRGKEESCFWKNIYFWNAIWWQIMSTGTICHWCLYCFCCLGNVLYLHLCCPSVFDAWQPSDLWAVSLQETTDFFHRNRLFPYNLVGYVCVYVCVCLLISTFLFIFF